MKLFGQEPQERAMYTLIHDTNGAISGIPTAIRLLRMRLKELNIEDKEIEQDLLYLASCKERVAKAIDAYYNTFKVDFKEDAETKIHN